MSGTLAVVSQTGETLSFFDLASGNMTGHIPSMTAEPHELCYDSKRSLLYVSHTYRYGHYWKHGENAHEISIVHMATKKVIGIMDTRPAKAPHGLIIDTNRDILYASVEELLNEEGGGVIGIDLGSRAVIKVIPSRYKSHWFVMTPDGKKAYTCNKEASFISILDLEKEKMIAKVDIPGGCEEPSISSDGNHVYFPTPGFQFGKNPTKPEIKIIDTTTDTIVNSIKMDNGALGVHVSPLGTILVGEYTYGRESSQKSDSARLAIYDPEKLEKLGDVETGLLPLTIRSSHDSKTAFVTNISKGTVSFIDIASKTVIRTLAVDGKSREDKPIHVGAHGMAFIP